MTDPNAKLSSIPTRPASPNPAPTAMSDWRENALFQFASGVAVAVGTVGITRAGHDTWIGVILIVFGLAFAMHSFAIAERLRRQQQARDDEERAQLRDLLVDRQQPAVPTSSSGRCRRWLSRHGR